MPANLVFTFIGADKPGLIGRLAQIVSECGGNWLESRMSELAGQFAGIVEIDAPRERIDELRDALQALAGEGLTVVLGNGDSSRDAATSRRLRLSILGPDRPGIVREVSNALAERQINITEMDTSVISAPMSAELLFEAVAEIQVPRTLDLADLNERLDEIADVLTVEIDLEESLR
jgi:glycine cleavage system regulatory protein